jgi:hypothetical protein
LTHPRVFSASSETHFIFAQQKSAKGIAELEQGAELIDAEAVLAAPTSA